MSPYRDVPSGGRSLGTMRPPAVTRKPGGLPCSLSSFSAFPRLNDGVGEGRFWGPRGAGAVPVGTLRLLFEDLLFRFAAADADGRKTCSNQRGKRVSLCSHVRQSERWGQ